MTTDPTIRQLIVKAIPLPDCPVKKAHAIASRAWLEKEFNAYIADLKKQYEQPVKPEPEDRMEGER